MTSLNNRKVFVYSSLFIALLLNVPKLFALKKNGIIAQFWHFDGLEFVSQTFINILFCLCIFFYSAHHSEKIFIKKDSNERLKYVGVNLLILIVFGLVGLGLERLLFKPGFFPGGGVLVRLVCSLILVYIELRIIYLLEKSNKRELENEHLRNENLKAGMELLKAQLNPHFFFNALSSLSAIIRENPPQAQVYITHLSKIFRYSLQATDNNLVPLKEELNAVTSYAVLMKMRHETGFDVCINVDDKSYNIVLPHMSLQPLIENAVKHNSVSAAKPLLITISLDGDFLSVSNNLQPIKFPEASTGIGLINLNERYKLLMKKEIDIIKTQNSFTIKLPVK